MFSVELKYILGNNFNILLFIVFTPNIPDFHEFVDTHDDTRDAITACTVAAPTR